MDRIHVVDPREPTTLVVNSPGSPGPRPRIPPPLPPRQPSTTMASTTTIQEPAPPPYSIFDTTTSDLTADPWTPSDHQASSPIPPSSITPSELLRHHSQQRTLLLIYIHGFMGNDTSFQNLPAHVHSFLAVALAETHVVHTKIYPRYKSRRAIEFARDNFSEWLEPHENDTTDIVLLGHSMGGLLAAEVALMPSSDPNHNGQFKHRILGTISFDTPFLGMHPGLVVSGIGSLFRPAPPPPGSSASSSSTTVAGTETGSFSSLPMTPGSPTMTTTSSLTDYSSISPTPSGASSIHGPAANDPYYNPPFPNDINMKERKGWSSVLHFANKHATFINKQADGLKSATKQYLMSHIEFGGCLADFSGLRNRYARLRYLEDVDDTTEAARASGARRIRFVNYYTASTGLPKRVKVKQEEVKGGDGNENVRSVEEAAVSNLSLEEPADDATTRTREFTSDEPGTQARVLVPETRVVEAAPSSTTKTTNLPEPINLPEHDEYDSDPPPMQHIDSMPIASDDSDFDNDYEFFDAREASPGPEEPAPAGSTPNPALSTTITTTTTTTTSTTPTEPTDPDPASTSTTPPPPPIPTLPPIPPPPTEPTPPDLTLYTDKDARKLVEKEHKRLVKAYQVAVKNREKAVRERKKVIEKREREREKAMKAEERERERQERERERVERERERGDGERERQEKERERLEKERERMEKERERVEREMGGVVDTTTVAARSGSAVVDVGVPATTTATAAAIAAAVPPTTATPTTATPTPDKPKKDKRFCLLPSDLERLGGGGGSSGGSEGDKCWVRVHMKDVDEVGAHCGLFFPGPQYEGLLGDVGERIVGWVGEGGRG